MVTEDQAERGERKRKETNQLVPLVCIRPNAVSVHGGMNYERSLYIRGWQTPVCMPEYGTQSHFAQHATAGLESGQLSQGMGEGVFGSLAKTLLTPTLLEDSLVLKFPPRPIRLALQMISASGLV